LMGRAREICLFSNVRLQAPQIANSTVDRKSISDWPIR
jgi:hypothetical protein